MTWTIRGGPHVSCAVFVQAQAMPDESWKGSGLAFQTASAESGLSSANALARFVGTTGVSLGPATDTR